MKEAFGGLSSDWKEGINWPKVRDYRLGRAREKLRQNLNGWQTGKAVRAV